MAGTPATAATEVFTGLDGRWRGSGTMDRVDGTKERLRCEVNYIVRQNDSSLQQTLRCDSDTYKFNVNSYIIDDSGSVSGSWDDSSNNVTGNVSGKINGKLIDVIVRGIGFTAGVKITTSANSQTVVITSNAGDIREVTIRLNRSR